MRPHLIGSPRLSSVWLFVSMEGDAWGGFVAERESRATYSPVQWPGLKEAIRRLCDWPDCIQGTVKPFGGLIRYELINRHGHRQTIWKDAPLREIA